MTTQIKEHVMFRSKRGSWNYPFPSLDKASAYYKLPFSISFEREGSITLINGIIKEKPGCYKKVPADAVLPKEAGEHAGKNIVDFIKETKDFQEGIVYLDEQFAKDEEAKTLRAEVAKLKEQLKKKEK